MRRPPHLRLLALAAALLLAACTGRSAAPSPYSAALQERGEVRVDVLNNNFSDATLWAIAQDARRIRLGSVTGKTDAVFTIPWRWSEDMRIEIDMVAGPRCVTRSIPVDPGDVLQLEIRPVFTDTADCFPVR